MSPLLGQSSIDWLLGLDRIRWGDPRAVLRFHSQLEPWHWVLIILAASVAATLSYRHLLGSRYGRCGLTLIRVALIVAIAALLAGPSIVVLDQHIERDWLIMLVDRSESMTIRDAKWAAGQLVSRDEAVRRALESQSELLRDEALLRHRHVVWLGFDETTYEIGAPEPEKSPLWAPPSGQTTLLRTALQQSLQRAAGKPIAGVVVISDGRSGQTTGAGLVRRLKQRGARVFSVPVGGDVRTFDLALRRPQFPRKAFVRDDVPVKVRIQGDPADGEVAGLGVRLVNHLTGELLDERSALNLNESVTLFGRASAAGQVRWRVELDYETRAGSTWSDPVPENNRHIVDVEFVDRAVRVLYVEGFPRWEYRYLKNFLLREKSISSSVLLASADRHFAQEGDEPISRLPSSPEEWAPYDVVIVGDVPADWIDIDQMTMLRDHIAMRGAGLLWIGGPFNTPHRYAGTPLAETLPMRQPALVKRLRGQEGVSMVPWPAAKALNVLQLRDPDEAPTDSTWPQNLPRLRWVQQLGPIKQIAEVLGASEPVEDAEEAVPLVLRMRYGSGQCVYLATDETWRWRYGRGEYYFEQFWAGLIRMLGRHRIQQHAQDIRFELSQRRVELGHSIVVDLRIEDPLIIEQNLGRLRVAVYDQEKADQRPLETFELGPQPTPDLSQSRLYRATWRPTRGGRLLLKVVEPALEDLSITEPIEVIMPDSELRHTAPDHSRLADLAEQTGGQVIALDELAKLATAATSRAQATDADLSEPLWDSPLALIVVLGLLTIEWVGRKLVRLV